MNAAGRWPRSWYAAGQGRRRKLEISNTQCAFDEPANVEVVPSKGGVGIFGGPLEQNTRRVRVSVDDPLCKDVVTHEPRYV